VPAFVRGSRALERDGVDMQPERISPKQQRWRGEHDECPGVHLPCESLLLDQQLPGCIAAPSHHNQRK
jgi:hypothetical protein